MGNSVFDLPDGSREIVRTGGDRYFELVADGYTPVEGPVLPLPDPYPQYATMADVAADAQDGGSALGAALSATYATPDSNVLVPLNIPTPDGNGNVTHPSVVYIAESFGGYRWWMAYTPFPDASRENPCIVASHDGITWVVPAGLTNPIYSAAQAVADQGVGAFNADTELVYLGGVLYCYWKVQTGATKVATYRLSSTNGVTWGGKAKVLEDTGGSETMISPAIVIEADGTLTMWTVNGTTTPYSVTRRTSADGGASWSATAACTVPSLVSKSTSGPWHIDVKRVGNTYHMLVSSYEQYQGDRLYYWTSADGVTWTGDTRRPAVHLTGITPDVARHYRSCMVPRSSGRWDLYVVALTADAATWRIVLHRDVPLPTLEQRKAATDADADRLRAALGLYPYVFGDAFNRADSTTTLGTSTSGKTWTALSGTAGILDGAAYCASGSSRQYVDLGIADVEIVMSWKELGDGAILLRATDSSNWLQVGTDTATGNANAGRLNVEKFAAGSLSNLVAAQSGKNFRNGDLVRVRAVGSSITVYRNEELVVSVVETFNQTATKHGIKASSGSRIDFIGVRPA